MKGYNRRVTIGGVKYDSKFEHRILQETDLTQGSYHARMVPYEVHSSHKYEPDYTVGNIHFEAKGRFIFKHDMVKYKHIKKTLDGVGQKLVFIFENANTRVPGAKPRKDGSYLTNGQWADRVGIRWVTVTGVNKVLKEIKKDGC